MTCPARGIVAILREHEQDGKVADICREHGLSQPTFYQWTAKYGGMGVSELRELRTLREENTKLKLKLADTILDRDILKEILGKSHRASSAGIPWDRAGGRACPTHHGRACARPRNDHGPATTSGAPLRSPLSARSSRNQPPRPPRSGRSTNAKGSAWCGRSVDRSKERNER